MPNRLFVFKSNKFSPFFEVHPTVYLKNVEDHLMYYGSNNPKNGLNDVPLHNRKLKTIYSGMNYFRKIGAISYILVNNNDRRKIPKRFLFT